MKVGVLALQGDFREHAEILASLGLETIEVRVPKQLQDCDSLIIPGGESTTIGKLADAFELMGPLREFGTRRPIWGTCAGAILLSQGAQREQPLLGLMDITVQRNAFGRQVHSFETELQVSELEMPEKPFRAVFIRAPLISRVGENVEVICRLPTNQESTDDGIVAARQGRFLATCFHPELTEDPRFHRYFIQMAQE
ncbi:MAG: pyridoxal 5'-phosphate synthase glutaminase subunit PdxT [Anaerolineales bacterium]